MAAPGFENSPLRPRGRFILTQTLLSPLTRAERYWQAEPASSTIPSPRLQKCRIGRSTCLTQRLTRRNVETGRLNVSNSRPRQGVRCNEPFCSMPPTVGSTWLPKPNAILHSKNLRTRVSTQGARGLRRKVSARIAAGIARLYASFAHLRGTNASVPMLPRAPA